MNSSTAKESKKILVFIGGRAGSKGVKGKNIRPLLGEPLVNHTIKQALRWKSATRVIVSTDGEEMAQIAKEAGAEVPFLRPKELATDTVSKVLAIKDALIKCEEIYKEKYDIVVDLDVTAPVRSVEDLDNCLKLYLESPTQTLFSVVEAHKNPYFNMVEKKKDGRIDLVNPPTSYIVGRQQAPKVYAMNASIYFYSREHLLNNDNPSPFSPLTKIYVMPDESGFDIDREVDFKFLEFLVKEGIAKL